jgi:hypothetical protein
MRKNPSAALQQPIEHGRIRRADQPLGRNCQDFIHARGGLYLRGDDRAHLFQHLLAMARAGGLAIERVNFNNWWGNADKIITGHRASGFRPAELRRVCPTDDFED